MGNKIFKGLNPFDTISRYVNETDINSIVMMTAIDELKKNTLMTDNSILQQSINSITANQFNYLYKPMVISLYTILEATIKDLIITLFAIETELVEKIDAVRNVKVSVIEYNNLKDDYERYLYVYEEYEKKIFTSEAHKYGVGRFEALLKPLNLSGQVPQPVEKQILELAQVRNCLVHRAGIVDRGLLKSCDWLKQSYKLGEEIIINTQVYMNYTIAVRDYTAILTKRITESEYTLMNML